MWFFRIEFLPLYADWINKKNVYLKLHSLDTTILAPPVNDMFYSAAWQYENSRLDGVKVNEITSVALPIPSAMVGYAIILL